MSPFGRVVLALGALGWLVAAIWGWDEFAVLSAGALLTLGLCALFVLGSSMIGAEIELDPARVFVGAPSAGRLVVVNRSKRRLFPTRVDLPIGSAVATFDVPSLKNAAEHEELFIVPTNRRAVLTVGPATAVQADPLGLLRRPTATSQKLEMFVHPTLVTLPVLGSGLLRDLEGRETKDLSVSDLAFHTLRDYVPGDDRRYVHWRSSAKAGKLLVRQFLDTRRSRVTVTIDAHTSSYSHADDFEIAVSVAASLGTRCLQDQLDLTVVGGGHAVTPADTRALLDTMSRAELGAAPWGLGPIARQASTLATDTSLAFMITGNIVSFAELRSAAAAFGNRVRVVVVRVEPDAPAGMSSSGDLTVLAVRQLADFPRLLAAIS